MVYRLREWYLYVYPAKDGKGDGVFGSVGPGMTQVVWNKGWILFWFQLGQR